MVYELTQSSVYDKIPKRDTFFHKYSVGCVLLLCGSIGYTGAPALAAMGALRSGIGLVFLGVPDSIYSIEAVKLTEPIVFPLPEKAGIISSESIHIISEKLNKVNAVLIGPGLGISEDAGFVVRYLLENYSGPIVLDADGITLAAQHKDVLRDRTGITVITPHEGEFSRFTGVQIADRCECAQSLANELGITVVLKGHNTVVSDGNSIYVNSTGNPGMAVGGCGDVLAGVIVSLLGQGMDPFDASACGVWLHGAAGDICAAELGQAGMLPTDMLNVLPRLLK